MLDGGKYPSGSRVSCLLFSVGKFFPFPDFAHDVQTLHISHIGKQNSWRLLQYKCMSVTAVRKPEIEVSNPTVSHTFYILLDTH